MLAGSGHLTKLNTGTLTLDGMTNSYGGGTTINQGTVSISGDVNLGAPATLTLNGGTLLVTAGTAANAAAGTATLSAGRGITLVRQWRDDQHRLQQSDLDAARKRWPSSTTASSAAPVV